MDRLYQWISWHLPWGLLYHATISASAKYSSSDEGKHREVPTITWDEVSRWIEKQGRWR